MEAEYDALSMAMKEVMPLQDLFKSVSHVIGLHDITSSTFKTRVWEDNMGCLLKLAKLAPGQ
jgi:hypothetical protein